MTKNSLPTAKELLVDRSVSAATPASHGPAQPLDTDIEGYLQHERRHLHRFFNKLADANIFTLRDLERYSRQDLFNLAPTSPANQERVMNYVRRGLITLRSPT